MGHKIEFNWALKLKPENGLNESLLKQGEILSFKKNEYRVYPVGVPIDLLNKDWEALARVVVLEFTNKDNKTTGKYKVLRIYSGEEKESITNYWRKDLETVKAIGAISK